MTAAASPAAYPPPSARFAWCLFDWASQPVFALITTFVFAPYFVDLYAGPAGGAAAREAAVSAWGFALGAAGFLIALGAPFLGAIADESGARKPFTFVFILISAAAASSLWFAAPGAPHAVTIALAGAVVATVGAEFAILFNNAMMPSLAPREALGRLSGQGWAMGYLAALVSLLLMLALLMTPDRGADPPLTFLGLDPMALFGVDVTAYEGERLSGPISAVWFIVFSLPLMLLTPDIPKRAPFLAAARRGSRALADNLRALRARPDFARFLAANVLYQDAIGAVFAFGGIFGASMFGWGPTEAGIFGIVVILSGIAGTLVGGRLDDALGSKPVIAGAIVLMLAALLGIVSITSRGLLFGLVPATAAAPGDGLFAAAGEWMYLGCGVLIGLVAGPLQAASRTLLARLSPPEAIAKNFGLFTLAGKATAFLGPTLVAIAVGLGQGIALGVVPIALLFAAGLALLLTVRVSRA